MISTANPKDKRTLSLFNPEFLPNFNDMMMYVANEPDESSVSLPWRTDVNYHNSSTIRHSLDNDAAVKVRLLEKIQTPVREPGYGSLGQMRYDGEVIDNLYAPVVREDRNNVEYNC